MGSIVVDLSALAPDVGTLEALARLKLDARRRGERLDLVGASTELRDLIEFAGLSEVLRVEPGRQPEDREERLRVEEERELDDPPA
jgi:anti-anti-sigma regulatory factor